MKHRYSRYIMYEDYVLEHTESAVDRAFEKFFDDWVLNVRGAGKGPDWGREYWQSHGVDVQNCRVVFASPQDRTLFLLKWL